jgi:hypothetical protein
VAAGLTADARSVVNTTAGTAANITFVIKDSFGNVRTQGGDAGSVFVNIFLPSSTTVEQPACASLFLCNTARAHTGCDDPVHL